MQRIKEYGLSALVALFALVTLVAYYLPWMRLEIKEINPIIGDYDLISYTLISSNHVVSGYDLTNQYGKIDLTVVAERAVVTDDNDVAKINLNDFSSKKWDVALPQPVEVQGDRTIFGFAVGSVLILALAAISIVRPVYRRRVMIAVIVFVVLMLGLHVWKFFVFQGYNGTDETIGRYSSHATYLIKNVVQIQYRVGWVLDLAGFILAGIFAALVIRQPVPEVQPASVQEATSSAD